MVAKRVWRGTAWEFGVNRCKLLHLGWIDNKILLHNTGNYIQYAVINRKGKGYEKEYIYMNIYEIYIYEYIYEIYMNIYEIYI